MSKTTIDGAYFYAPYIPMTITTREKIKTGDWTQTFLWKPKKSISGKYIIGKALVRKKYSRVVALSADRSEEIPFGADWTLVSMEYAKPREAFVKSLKGEA